MPADLQLRLLDRFGDNGIIAIVIVRMTSDHEALVDTWLMSCRVLGRGVEEATLNLVVEAARRLGAKRLIGEYRPTAKNGMVREHYRKLGFIMSLEDDAGRRIDVLDVDRYVPANIFIAIKEGRRGMTEAEAYVGLTELFRELLADDAIVLTAETTADDVEGWDSFTHLNLIVATETRFGIKMRTDEIEGFTKVGDLVAIIVARAV